MGFNQPIKPFKLAVLGSGPSAFYLTQRLLNQLPYNPNHAIHMYERLPVPFGLVRYGVAPDHPDVKNCVNSFSRAASDNRFKFYGGVSVGDSTKNNDISLSLLAKHYTHLAFSYGASQPTHLRIPGSVGSSRRLRGVYSAADLVGWYNGHPDYTHLHDSLSADLSRARKVAIIGQGNVGLDIARVLLTTNRSAHALSHTDIPSSVLHSLQHASIDHVDLVGRRGPAQVAFTAKETREMMHLPDVAMKSVGVGGGVSEASDAIHHAIMHGDQHASNDREWRAKKRILNLLADGSKCGMHDAAKTWGLRFLLSPTHFHSKQDKDHLTHISFAVNKLTETPPSTSVVGGEPATQTPARVLATPTAQTHEEEYDLAIESIGYRAHPLGNIPFDTSRGVIRNSGGRVIGEDGVNIPNVYSTGWASRGPVGVIASTMYDSYSVADTIVSDLHSDQVEGESGEDEAAGVSFTNASHLDWAPSTSPLPGVPPVVEHQAVKWSDWLRINQAEIDNGKDHGKLREKFLTVDAMMGVLRR
ncbi:hypothetical protein E3P91_01886 [Wallemia ichthyophaga]|nr:hypothetical protein E3P91_01886 [Wallemia ichthyophaga]TIB63016.1 hypothetical protein E3P78_02028 [Wallemia ichthyophaga]